MKRLAAIISIAALAWSAAGILPSAGGAAELSLPAAQEKDFWEKLDAVSGLLSGLIVALIGGAATYIYNERQRSSQAVEKEREMRTMEVQTVASFLPHLQSGSAKEKEAALVAMSALGNTALVARLAKIYRDDASVSALSQIASGADPEARKLAEASLEQILTGAVVKVSVGDGAMATGFAVSPTYVVTADYVVGDDAEPAVSVSTVDDVAYGTTIAGRDQEHGILVLRTEEPIPGYLRLLDPGVPLERVGDLTMLGWGGHGGWQYSLGQLRGSQAGDGPASLRAKIQTEPGQGGAPIVDRAGRVVAMHYAAQREQPDGPREALLVPADTIRAGLDALQIPPLPR